METIRKIICAEESRNRVCGILPFVRYNEYDCSVHRVVNETDNYGNFVCDIVLVSDEKEEKRLRYLDILRRYENTQEELKNGIFLKKITIKRDETTGYGEGCTPIVESITKNVWAPIEYKSVEDETERSKYDYVPYSVEDFSKDNIYYVPSSSIEDNYIVLLENYDSVERYENNWNEWWGKEKSLLDANYSTSGNFIFCKDVEKYVLGTSSDSKRITFGTEVGAARYLDARAPFIDIDNVFVNDIVSEDLYFPYEYSVIDGEMVPVVQDYSGTTYSGTASGFMESSLDDLVSEKAISVGDTLFGILKPFLNDKNQPIGQLFKCTYHKAVATDTPTVISGPSQIVGIRITESEETKTYEWWECFPINATKAAKYKCADGERVTAKTESKYRNATIVACVDSMIRMSSNALNDGDYYYIMAKFDNGSTNHVQGMPIDGEGTIVSMDIPYETGQKYNQTLFESESAIVYDTITDIDRTESSLTITYELGKDDNGGANIICKETFPYSANVKTNVMMDYLYDTEVYYNKIDTSANDILVYNPDFNLYRTARQAEITEMKVGTNWTSGSMITTMLITKENSNGVIDTPKTSVDVVFDRGNATAWESHYKLEECNTLEDLENYSNGFFNI